MTRAILISAVVAATFSCKKDERSADDGIRPVEEPGAQNVLDGAYNCGFGTYGEVGDRFLCLIAIEADGTRSLRKMHGTEQVRGTITPSEAGFRFEGEYASDYPDVFVTPVTAEFAATGQDRYRGTFDRPGGGGQAALTLSFVTGEYGGATYGDQHAQMNWTAEEVEAKKRELREMEALDAEGEQ